MLNICFCHLNNFATIPIIIIKLERPFSCFIVARCWCNISTPSCCTIACLSFNAWTDDHTRFCIFQFLNSLGNVPTEGKIISLHSLISYLTFFNLPRPAATATATTATASRLRSQKLHIVLWGLHVGLVL